MYFADKLIKSTPKYLVKTDHKQEESSFDRISCRWNPIKSHQGIILTLMIKAKSFENYKSIQESLERIIGSDEKKINPVKVDEMDYMKLAQIYKRETKYDTSQLSLSSIKRKVEILFCFFIFKLFRPFQSKRLYKYTQSMSKHTDYRKFDDILRMVVDCSQEQVKEIIKILNGISDIKYGYSCSDHALMTCLVFGLNEGEHIHFIGGANGGYTEAAKMMKSQ